MTARAFIPLFFLVIVTLPALTGCSRTEAPSAPDAEFYVESIAERIVDALPDEPLYWKVEKFDSLESANSERGLWSLPAEAGGQAWLFTLGPKDETAGGILVAEIGPVPVIETSRYLLRINHAGGPSGATTSVHSHPGSEAFYVLSGQLTQRTSKGMTTLNAGESMNGHEPGLVMQLTSSGADDLEQLVMFVVDADKPFSSPESFE